MTSTPVPSGARPKPRFLSLLATATLFAAAVPAQCPEGTNAGLVPWTSSNGYASTWPADDEGLSPLINLGFSFPMPGLLAFDAMQIGSNGEIYLADWIGAPPPPNQPVGGSSFGTNTVPELQGSVAGGSPRIVVMGRDQWASRVACNIWEVSYSLAPGQVTVTWTDMAAYWNQTDRQSYSCKLLANGSVEFSYSIGLNPGACLVGISTGNLVAATAGDLSAASTASATSCLYELFPAAGFDLAGQTLRIDRLVTGYTTPATGLVPYTPPNCAYHCEYNQGCYDIDGGTLYQRFANAVTAKAALDSTRLQFILDQADKSYLAVWNAGGGTAFKVPGSGATTLTSFMTDGGLDLDNGSEQFTPGPAVPSPGDPILTWTVSVNGILTAGGSPNNPGDATPTAAEIIDVDKAPELAFYTWHDYLLNDTAPNGTISWEVVDINSIPTWLYVTWNAVESKPVSLTPNPSTWQYQIHIPSGNVWIVWQSLESTSTLPVLVGCTMAGPGATPGAVVLDSLFLPTLLKTNIEPLTLTAAPRPVRVGAWVTFDYTIDNVPEVSPLAGTYIAVVGLSLGYSGAPFDLHVIGMPGCNAHVQSFDVFMPVEISTINVGPYATLTSPFNSGNIIPPLDFYAQAFALILPGHPVYGPLGNNLGLISNVVHSHVEWQ